MINNEIIKEYERLYDAFRDTELKEDEIFGFPQSIEFNKSSLLVEESEKHYGALFPKEQMFTVNIINATTENYFVTDVEIVENFDNTEIEIVELTNTELKSESITPLTVIIDFSGLKDSYYSFSFLIKTNIGLPLKQKVHFALNENGRINFENKVRKTKNLELKINRKNNEYYCKNENVEIFIPEQEDGNRLFISSNNANYVQIINKNGNSKIMEMPALNTFSSTFDSADKYFMFKDNRGRFINQFNTNIFLIDNNFNIFQQVIENGKDKIFIISVSSNTKVKLSFPKFVEKIDKETINNKLNYFLRFNYAEYYKSKNISHFIKVIDAKDRQVLEIPVKFTILYSSLTVEKIFAEININQEQIFLPKVEANIKFQTIGIGKAQIEIPNEYIRHKAQIISTKQTNLINYKLEIDTQLFKNNKEHKIVIPVYVINENQKLKSFEITLKRLGIYYENSAGSVLGEYLLYYPYGKKIQDTISFEDESIEIIDFELKKIDINGGNAIIISKQENVLSIRDEIIKNKISDIKYLGKNKFEYIISSAFLNKSSNYDYGIVLELLTNTGHKVLLYLNFRYRIYYCQHNNINISFSKQKTQDSKVVIINNKNNYEPLCIYGIEETDNVRININSRNFKGYPIIINPSSSLQISCIKSITKYRGLVNLKINNKDKYKIEI